MVEVTLFSISLAVMLFMIVFRVFELKIGKDIISTNFRQKSDNIVLFIFRKISYFFVSIWRKIVFGIKKSFMYVFHVFVSIWEFFVHKSAKYIDMIRGRDVSSNGGKISYFTERKLEEEDLQS